MDDYSTEAFLQSFAKFSCEFVYLKSIPIDKSSQLVKGCETMRIRFAVIRGILHQYMMVEFYSTLLVGTVSMLKLNEGFDM